MRAELLNHPSTQKIPMGYSLEKTGVSIPGSLGHTVGKASRRKDQHRQKGPEEQVGWSRVISLSS